MLSPLLQHIAHSSTNVSANQMPYPLICQVNRLPQCLQGQSQLNFHTRTFESFSLTFQRDSEANAVFDSVKELTVAREFHLVQ